MDECSDQVRATAQEIKFIGAPRLLARTVVQAECAPPCPVEHDGDRRHGADGLTVHVSMEVAAGFQVTGDEGVAPALLPGLHERAIIRRGHRCAEQAESLKVKLRETGRGGPLEDVVLNDVGPVYFQKLEDPYT